MVGGGRTLGHLYNMHFFIELVTFNFNCRFRYIPTYIYIIMSNNNNNNDNNNDDDNIQQIQKRSFGSSDGWRGVGISCDDRVYFYF